MDERREIRLLGEPAILGPDGEPREVRGHQAWAVLARVLLSRKPLDRRQLAAEIFTEAADPLGALRWCLAALRRALDEPLLFRGDPIQPALPDDIRVDVVALQNGERLTDDPGDLLSGLDIRSSIELSTWLLVERQRLAALVEAGLRTECLRALASGDSPRAIRLAEAAVRRNPLEESVHVLLVKALAQAGRGEAALEHAGATERQFLEELGARPSAALRAAARRPANIAVAGVSREAQARSLLATGKAALSGGASDAGIDALRRAAGEAEGAGARELLCDILIELGTALIHTVRGHDDEGAVVMRQAAALAEAMGRDGPRAAALRELGYVEALAGRRPAAAAYLAEAAAYATEIDRKAGIESVLGFNLVDWGRLEDGLSAYEQALGLAQAAGNRRREAWCLGLGARGRLANGDPAGALAWLEQCLVVLDELRWVAFRPWPVALRAEALLALGEAPAILRPDLEAAFVMSCELNDPCWEGAAARVLGHSFEAEGRYEDALHWLREALLRTSRDINAFAAQRVDVLEDQARVLRKAGQELAAQSAAQDWIASAARYHMHGSVTRATAFITGSGG